MQLGIVGKYNYLIVNLEGGEGILVFNAKKQKGYQLFFVSFDFLLVSIKKGPTI